MYQAREMFAEKKHTAGTETSQLSKKAQSISSFENNEKNKKKKMKLTEHLEERNIDFLKCFSSFFPGHMH